MITKYFKTNDGKFLKLDYDYSQDSFSPRDPRYQTNLGTMVFPKVSNRRYTLGDIQPENFEEFFKDELSDEQKFMANGKFTIKLPSVEDAKNNPLLEKFIAGTDSEGYWFDKPFFQQEIESMLSSIYIDDDNDINLSAGIPVLENENQRLSNILEIDFEISESEYKESIEEKWQMLKQALAENLNEYKLDWNYDINKGSNLERMSETELFDKWAETKLCVIPIDIYEHSSMTCHEASLTKTLHASNDRDDGTIYNNGFIYVDKDNEEVLNELKGEARDKDGNVYNKWKPKSLEETKDWAESILRAEIKEYGLYLEGNVYDASVYEFNPKTMDWEEPVVGYNFLITDNVEKYIMENNEYAGKIERKINHEEMKEIEKTPTPEFKKVCFENFKSKILDILPEFDGNPKYAFSAASIALKNNPLAALERTALSEYMKEKGCDTEIKLFEFIDKSLGIKAKDNSKTIKPIALSFKDSSLDCIYSKIKNPQRSDNGCVNNLLLIDWGSKRYSFFNGCSYAIDPPSDLDYHKVELLSSGKAVEGRLNTLVRSGFKNTPVENEYYEQYRKKNDWIKKHIEKQTERER